MRRIKPVSLECRLRQENGSEMREEEKREESERERETETVCVCV